jgi:hypothetical protein
MSDTRKPRRNFKIVSYSEGFAALDTLHHATEYLAAQYSDFMTRPEAQAHFDARALLFRRGMALLDEMELAYFYEPQVRS